MKSSTGTFYGNVLKTNQEYFSYLKLPTFSYSGYAYRVYPDIGAMDWYQAVGACDDLTYGGFTDWYLPSKAELNAMYEQKSSIGGFSDTWYWSSTENGTGMWCQNFSDGRQGHFYKSSICRVRCVRREN